MNNVLIYLAGLVTPILILIVIVIFKVTKGRVSGQNSKERVKENVISVIGD